MLPIGVLHKFLVSPASRAALVSGKALSAGVRALAQALIVYALAAAMHVGLRWGLMPLLGIVIAVILGAAVFSTFSLIVACLVKSRERFMGIGQLLTMPLFFASNAIYPLSLMPSWLRVISRGNPLTYQVDALRALMIVGGGSAFGMRVDFLMQWLALAVLVAVATKVYPGI